MTDLRPERLRRGEVIAGLSGGALLTSALTSRRASGATRPVVVLAAASGVALTYTQATREAPALPVTVSAVATTLGALATTSLLVRALRGRARPAPLGAAATVTAAAALTAGAFLSLRQEDGWVPDAEHPIERVTLAASAGATATTGAGGPA